MPFQTATNPSTGEKVVLVGNEWKPYTQSATNAQGGKAFLVNNNWLTDEGIPQGRTGADQIPGIMPQVQPVAEPERSFLDKARGVIETGAGLVSGAVTAPIVTGAEILGTLTSGKFGTPEGIRAGESVGKRVAQQIQYQPRTQAGQEYTQGVGNALASTGLQGVPLNVLSDFGRVARPAIQAAPGMVQEGLAARTARLATERSDADWARASQIDAAQAAQRLGVVVNPAKSNPTALTKTLVSATGEVNVNAKAAQRNAPRWNELAREDMGLPANTPLTPEAFERARSAHTAPYDSVRNIGQLAPSSEVTSQLQKLKLDPLSTSDPAKAAKVNGIIDRATEQISQGLSGENVIGQIRGFRKDATRVLQNNNASPIDIEVAESQLGIANSLENLIEANITDPKGLEAFRAARTAIAKTYDWERSTGITTKQVDPVQIVKMAEKGKPLSGKLADVATVAGNFPDSSTLTVAREPLMYQRLRRGGIGGTVGFYVGGGPAGAAVGAGLTDLGTSAAANFLTRQGTQNRLAIPRDNRIPFPQEPGAPFEPIPQGRAVVPYDYSQQTFTPPNFTIVPNQYGPRVTPGPGPDVSRALPAPSAESTMGALRAEDARRAGISRALGQEAEARAAQSEAAARRPTSGELIFDLDPITGRLREVSQGIKGATPETFSNFGSALETASGKIASGKPFDLTAAEKVAWDKTRVDISEIAPGFQSLNDKAIATKMMDRQWVTETLKKAQEKAKAFQQLAARAKDERARQTALMNRERMMDLAEGMEESLRSSRPVVGTTQGPKTREHIRNQLVGNRESTNKLAD
jgi:hypothetical protein